MYIPLNLLSIALFILGSTIPVTAQEAPTKQFQQQDIPLVWIYDEWYQKYGTTIPMFACVCVRQSCNTRPSWPFRSFNRLIQFLPLVSTTAISPSRVGLNV
ncbi:MAG: hypothetical protein MGG11_07365 [Trichodesmium sp. MAG_R03]|nr:hypothetical protein [Trichodesmium sp. MAG_R03]